MIKSSKFVESTGYERRLRHYGILVVACGLLLTACQTGSKPKNDENLPPTLIVDFEPSMRSTTLRLQTGRYPNLFTANTAAVWVSEAPIAPAVKGGAVPPVSGDATMLAANPGLLVVQCTMESAFSDMSIAYDVVGFRGLSVYLQTPDGRQVIPAQTIIGSELTETRRGALKVFRRTNLLVFSRQEAALKIPVVNGEGASTRVVLEGLESTFYFEWFPHISETVKLEAEKYSQNRAREDKRKKNVISKKVKGWAKKLN